MLSQLAVAILSSAVIAAYARRRGSLSDSGAVAALFVGTAIYCGGGWRWFAALFVFFVTSTLLGKVGRGRKASLSRDYSKGDTRDGWQVLANGGIAALCGLMAALSEDPGAAFGGLAGGFVGALATATADTWATELGPLSAKAPRSLVGFRRVPAGTSGAVSGLGLMATAVGGGVVGVIFGLWEPGGLALWGLVGAGAGAFGAMVDSVLGATVQSRFYCDRCVRACEGAVHSCGEPTRHTGGIRWFGNDGVNVVATILGAGVGAVLWGFLI